MPQDTARVLDGSASTSKLTNDEYAIIENLLLPQANTYHNRGCASMRNVQSTTRISQYKHNGGFSIWVSRGVVKSLLVEIYICFTL